MLKGVVKEKANVAHEIVAMEKGAFYKCVLRRLNLKYDFVRLVQNLYYCIHVCPAFIALLYRKYIIIIILFVHLLTFM